MGDVLKKFGRYFLLDQLAQGGMAEIYRARLASVGGAGRLMVIKRIQAGYGSNSEFLEMFKSEIKVTMGFNHPNIVQLYDFGEEQDQPYIAMELVDGKNLRQFMSRFTESQQTFPIELATFIIEQSASGLNYAHSFKDKITGEPFNIVHRDISPQNILISYEGNVKVIDFGIAKATTNNEATRAGVIKGKPSYLSPEQISGEPLDGRSDIFALGAVFWEILTGKKLFAGENDLAVLKLIESCQTYVKPPSTLNPKIPKELDYIVLKSLAKQREKRYQSAEELQRALHKFLYSFMSEFNPSDLSYYAKDLFKNEIVEDRKKIQKLNDKVEQLLASNLSQSSIETPSEEGTSTTKEDTTTLVESRPQGNPRREVFSLEEATNGNIEIEMSRSTFPSPSSSVSSSSSSPLSGSPSSNPSKSSAPKQRYSSNSTKTYSPVGRSLIVGAAAVLAVAILGPDYGIKIPILSDLLTTEKKVEKKVSLPISNVDRSAASTPSDGSGANLKNVKTLLLKLNLSPAGGAPVITVREKLIGEKILNASKPEIQVPLDSPLEITVERSGYKSFKRLSVLKSEEYNGLAEYQMDIQQDLDPQHFGFLSIHTTPSSDATILLNGSPWKKQTPLENEKFPVGTYSIHLTNDVLGMEKTVSITIDEGKAVNIDTQLEVKN